MVVEDGKTQSSVGNDVPAAFPHLSRVLTSPALPEILAILRAEFGGDLDALLLLLTICAGSKPDRNTEVLKKSGPGRGRKTQTSTFALSRSSGIPRESVRRKLTWMEARGWVVRDDTGEWVTTHIAAEDLQPPFAERWTCSGPWRRCFLNPSPHLQQRLEDRLIYRFGFADFRAEAV
ncbi:hypothetical protein [Rhodovulum sp. 12E13]|uniref:hypothetical protein n=1 Tax=Rhodovulum sp. 12E13 TaxID=2203891 RepID=UPI0013144434|nr:hypothetical protein [Rhodovulum sp. 12E13]